MNGVKEELESTCPDDNRNRRQDDDVICINAIDDDVQLVSEEMAECREVSEKLNNSLERDFKFLRTWVNNVDKEVLYSLLLSQMNNPRRLEVIMCDILNIPQAAKLISLFWDYIQREEENKTEDLARMYKKQILEMFPDVEMEFLNWKCKDFTSEDECNRFINTEMLTGLYPKSTKESTRVDNKFVPLPVVYSSDEEPSLVIPKPIPFTRGSSLGSQKNPNEGTSFGSTAPSTSISPSENVPVIDITDTYLEDGAVAMSTDDTDVSISDEGPYHWQETSYATDNSYESMDTTWKVYRGESSSRSDSGEIWNFMPRNLTSTAEDTDMEFESTEDDPEEWVTVKTEELIRLFPNTDPSFLRAECVKFKGSLEAMNEFVVSKLEKNDMPSRRDYEKRMELEELQNRYTTNFSIEDFLRVIPDPWKYFSDRNRNCMKYKYHSLSFLKKHFKKILYRIIHATLIKNNCNLYLSYKELKKNKTDMRVRQRCDYECNSHRPTTINIQFLQEVAFIENEEKIKMFIEAREAEKRLKFEEAKKAGILVECQCCFDSEVMIEDTVYCPKEHCFCKSCLVKFVEVEMGQGKCQFSCLSLCGENYTLGTLQNVLRPELFSKVIQLNQMEEIKAAGIEDLVQCPFCNYATIMPTEVKVMTCLNPECLKESCRLCKELSHVPLRCDEVEKSEEVNMRIYIEKKMTDALIRKCYNCNKGFVKEEGCNKIVCTCGAKMCYICRQPVVDYSHFNGQGGTEYDKCPLYSTNDELHVDAVQQMAEKAKAEVLRANPNKTLKHDPTLVLPQRTYQRPMPGMNRGNAAAAPGVNRRNAAAAPGVYRRNAAAAPGMNRRNAAAAPGMNRRNAAGAQALNERTAALDVAVNLGIAAAVAGVRAAPANVAQYSRRHKLILRHKLDTAMLHYRRD